MTDLDQLANAAYLADMRAMNEPESLLPAWASLDEFTQKRYRAVASALRSELQGEVIASVKVGSGMYRSGWNLKEVSPDSRGHRLILQQDVTLPGDAILIIIGLAERYREQRDWERKPIYFGDLESGITASFTPKTEVGQKNREITLEIKGRTLYMGVATLLRLADTLTRYRETGSLKEEKEP